MEDKAATKSDLTEPPAKMEGYFKLQGESFEHVITTLDVLLGRNRKSTIADDGPFVGIGSSKLISRSHARVTWLPQHRSFCLVLLGKNGANVDGQQYRSKTSTQTVIRLKPCTPIQIGEVKFWFRQAVSASAAGTSAIGTTTGAILGAVR